MTLVLKEWAQKSKFSVKLVRPGRSQTFKLTPSLRSTDDELSASQLNCEPHREFNYVFILNWHILSLVNPFQSQFHKLFRFDESNSTLLPQPRSRKSAMNSRDQVLAGQWFTRRLVQGWEKTYFENGRMLRQLTSPLKCQKADSNKDRSLVNVAIFQKNRISYV